MPVSIDYLCVKKFQRVWQVLRNQMKLIFSVTPEALIQVSVKRRKGSPSAISEILPSSGLLIEWVNNPPRILPLQAEHDWLPW